MSNISYKGTYKINKGEKIHFTSKGELISLQDSYFYVEGELRIYNSSLNGCALFEISNGTLYIDV